MQGKIKILLASGGTGGHFYPAIALGQELRDRGCELLYSIHRSDLLIQTLEKEKFQYVTISSHPILGRSLLKKITNLFKNCFAIYEGLKAIQRFQPSAIVGFGAYPSVPLVLAGTVRGIPILIHEQNMAPGWANRFCSHFAKKVAVSFEESLKFFNNKAVLTGNPLRKEFFITETRPQSQIRQSLGLKENLKTIFIFGGSGGAKALNRVLPETAGSLAQYEGSLQFLHVSGSKTETDLLQQAYGKRHFHAVVMDYAHSIVDCYRSSDLVICRSGATTISELIALKIPAILIPFPYAIGDHQYRNALALEKAGAAFILRESPALSKALAVKLNEILASHDSLDRMRQGFHQLPLLLNRSKKELADLVLEIVR